MLRETPFVKEREGVRWNRCRYVNAPQEIWRVMGERIREQLELFSPAVAGRIYWESLCGSVDE